MKLVCYSGAGKCSKYVKCALILNRLNFARCLDNIFCIPYMPGGKWGREFFASFWWFQVKNLLTLVRDSRPDLVWNVTSLRTISVQRFFFLAETASCDVWEHVLRLCQLVQPPQRNPLYLPKVKFLIYGAILITFETQHFYMLTNNNWD